MMIAVMYFQWDVFYSTCNNSSFCRFNSLVRLFGHPFFDGSNASEILKLNRKFTTEFDALNKINEELKNPNSKISKEGMIIS